MTSSVNTPRTICLVTSYAGSVIGFRGELISSLVCSGTKVFVLAPNHSDSTRSGIVSLGAFPHSYPLNRSGFNPISDIRAFFFLYQFFKKHRVDSVLTYFVKPNIWGMLAASFARVPIRVALVEGLGLAFSPSYCIQDFLFKFLIASVVKVLYAFSLRFSKSVVVLNSADRKMLVKCCGISPRKIQVLGGIGIDLSKWRYSLPQVNPFTFIFIGRLIREKGILEYLRAAELVKKVFPDVRFLVVGALDYSQKGLVYSSLVSAVNSGAVEWIGSVKGEDVASWLDKSSVFVLPSYYREGVPRSSQEAMAIGRPIITTNLPGCRDTVIDGANGIYVPHLDHIALSTAMQYFIRNPQLVVKMGAVSRLIAERSFDVFKKNAILIALLQ